MGTYIDELINSSVSSVKAKVSKLPEALDLQSLNIGTSISSDKIFDTLSKSDITSNVFGVFDTKQVVKELSGSITDAFSTELIEDLNPENLKNMATKIGSEITSDIDFNSAVESIMSTVGDIKQQAQSFTDGAFGDVVTVITETGAEIKATLLETVSLSPTISGMIPNSVSSDDFSVLKEVFNAADGLSNFNTCPNLNDVFGYASSLINLSSLFGNIQSLFAILAKYDITGILSCVQDAFDQLDSLQISDLTNNLIDSGSINSFTEMTGFMNNGTIADKYDLARSIGSSASDTTSEGVFDSLFTNLSIDKSNVFTSKNNTGNASIINQSTEPIYDQVAVASSSQNFSSYCFDNGFDQTLRAIPETLF